MDQQSVILPNVSLFLVDRGWSLRQQKARSVHATASYQLESKVVQESTPPDNNALKVIDQSWSLRPTTHRCKKQGSSGTDQCSGRVATPKSFAFINATRPGHAQEPEVQRLVKSHVKKGLKRAQTVRSASQATSVALLDKSDESGTARKRDQGTATLTASSLSSTTASGSSSPLYGNGVFPVPIGSRSQVLLTYCTFERA